MECIRHVCLREDHIERRRLPRRSIPACLHAVEDADLVRIAVGPRPDEAAPLYRVTSRVAFLDEDP